MKKRNMQITLKYGDKVALDKKSRSLGLGDVVRTSKKVDFLKDVVQSVGKDNFDDRDDIVQIKEKFNFIKDVVQIKRNFRYTFKFSYFHM